MKIQQDIKKLIQELRHTMKEQFKRHVSIQDLLSDRYETAEFMVLAKGLLATTTL